MLYDGSWNDECKYRTSLSSELRLDILECKEITIFSLHTTECLVTKLSGHRLARGSAERFENDVRRFGSGAWFLSGIVMPYGN